jgi:hypothetical protein
MKTLFRAACSLWQLKQLAFGCGAAVDRYWYRSLIPFTMVRYVASDAVSPSAATVVMRSH